MKFGIVPAHGPKYLDDAIAQVKLCEDLGIDSVWIEEHHADGPYWPTPTLGIAALAPYTSHVLLGTDILVLPLHDPVHVAEQFAVLDVITQGRMVLAVALGDSPTEFNMFRVKASRRGAAFEEQIRVIRALWTGKKISFSGDAYQYRDVELPVVPVQANGVPIWIGGWGPMQLERAVRLGDAWMPGPVGDLPGVVERQRHYFKLLEETGEDPLSRERPLTRDVVVATSNEEAWEMAEKDILPAYQRDYLDSDHPLVGMESGTHYAGLRELAKDRLIIGDPGRVIEETIRCVRATQTNHLIFRLKLPGFSPPAITQMVRLLGREVVPALRSELADV